MDFKEALPIEKKDWTGIGKYLGNLVEDGLREHGSDYNHLAALLRRIGHSKMIPEFISEYLNPDTTASIGFFFVPVRKILAISPSRIFKQIDERTNQSLLQGLASYLVSYDADTLTGFLLHRPGEELRNHVAGILRGKREEMVRECFYHTIHLDISQLEQDDNPDEVFYAAAYLVSKGYPLSLPAASPGRQIASNAEELLRGAVASELASSPESPPEDVIQRSEIRISPNQQRRERGYDIDFVYPEDYVDTVIVKGLGMFGEVPVESWQRAYTSGDLGGFEDDQAVANLGFILGFGMDELVPTRQPTEAERYEVHQRWRYNGGWGRPGLSMKQLEALEKGMPSGYEEPPTDDVVYEVNSGLAISLPLAMMVKDLIK